MQQLHTPPDIPPTAPPAPTDIPPDEYNPVEDPPFNPIEPGMPQQPETPIKMARAVRLPWKNPYFI